MTGPRPPADVLAQGITAYILAYFSATGALVANSYPSLRSVLPSSLMGPKSVLGLFCKDGLAILTQPAADYRFIFRMLEDRVDEALNSLKLGPIDFRLDIEAGSDLEVGLSNVEILFELPDGEQRTWQPVWDSLTVTNDFRPSRWHIAMAQARGERDVLRAVAANLMDRTNDKPDEVIAAIAERIQSFRRLLNRQPPPAEEELQVFLSINGVILCPTAIRIIPKHRFADRHVTDFVIQSDEDEYVLVEIEPSDLKLFTKKGNPSAELTHAVKQTKDWRQWVADHLSFAQEGLPGVQEPECWVIIGRDSGLDSAARKALKRENRELPRIRIKTYDALVREAEAHLRNLKTT